MKKRFISLLCVFLFVFTSLVGRCAYIALGTAYQISDGYNSYTLHIGTLYTNIFDRTGKKINNNSKSYVAVIRPNEKCLSELDMLFNEQEIAEITSELSQGYPVTRTVAKKADTKYIKIFEKINDGDLPADHLLKKEYGGLEQYVSEEIGTLSVNFSVDALGRLLSGDEGTVVNDNYDSNEGIIISLDSNIQKIAEEAASDLPKGAVVIMESESSRILASVSRGNDYINRALSPYAVGSVFKLIVSACAIENDMDLLYNCSSKIRVSDTEFHCQDEHAHGIQNMKQALANSCNCYFVNLALNLGADKIISTAEKFGFGKAFELYDEWTVKSGTFPQKSELNSLGQLALIGFGQGMLTDSPIHFASAVSCIANGGNYSYPTLKISDVADNQIISENTAKKLRQYMRYVVSDGTGANADYKDNSAGKTATAQSGIYNNGVEVLNTWFAGFYPYDDPKYTIIVMREDGISGSGDCCPIFRSIVEKLDKI